MDDLGEAVNLFEGHARFLADPFFRARCENFVEPHGQGRERCAQLVGSVGGECRFRLEPFGEHRAGAGEFDRYGVNFGDPARLPLRAAPTAAKFFSAPREANERRGKPLRLPQRDRHADCNRAYRGNDDEHPRACRVRSDIGLGNAHGHDLAVDALCRLLESIGACVFACFEFRVLIRDRNLHVEVHNLIDGLLKHCFVDREPLVEAVIRFRNDVLKKGAGLRGEVVPYGCQPRRTQGDAKQEDRKKHGHEGGLENSKLHGVRLARLSGRRCLRSGNPRREWW